MATLFVKMLNMSITAGYFVIAIILLRLVLRKAPKWLTCSLWGLVGLRLVCPFSFESVLSLIPSKEFMPQETVSAYSTFTPSVSQAIEYAANNPGRYEFLIDKNASLVISEICAPDNVQFLNPLQIFTTIFSVVWVVGIAAMLIYTLISYLRVYKKVRESIILKDNIYICDNIDTPFIFGVFRPKIYIPSYMNEEDREYVIAHEKAHLKRLDHLWKPLGFLLLSVYWFNPVLWVAYILLCRDIEFACDEKVLKNMGTWAKKFYSNVLVNCSTDRKVISACPVAFGETGVKKRIKTALSYKKPTFWVVIASLVVCVAVAVCFGTNPKTEALPDGIFYAQGNDIMHPYIDISTKNKTIARGMSIWASYAEHFTYKEANGKIEIYDFEGKKTEHTIKVQKDGVIFDGVGYIRAESYPASEISDEDYEYLTQEFFGREYSNENYSDFNMAQQFLTCSYSDVRDIDFSTVFYLGLPNKELKKQEYDILTEKYGDSCPFSKAPSVEMNEVLKKYTGLSVNETNKKNLDKLIYLSEFDTWYSQHGDTNHIKPVFEGGYITDDGLTILYYNNGNEVTLRKKTYGEYVIVSNQLNEYNRLSSEFPEYYGLSTEHGLKVYVWKTRSGEYSFGLAEGDDETYSTLWRFKFVSLDDMREILASYNVTSENITLEPINHPLSSFLWDYENEFDEKEKSRIFCSLMAFSVNEENETSDLPEKDSENTAPTGRDDGLSELIHLYYNDRLYIQNVIEAVYYDELSEKTSLQYVGEVRENDNSRLPTENFVSYMAEKGCRIYKATGSDDIYLRSDNDRMFLLSATQPGTVSKPIGAKKSNYIFDEADGDIYGFETKTDYELTNDNSIVIENMVFIISDIVSKNKTDGYEYSLHENGFAEITYCSLNQKNITIPSTLDGHPVGYIGENAFIYAKPESVTVPEGIMAISGNAFGTTLRRVTLPESLIVLGKYAFYGCGLLEKAELKSGLQIVGENCFAKCSSLKEVDIPSNVKVLGRGVFADCTNLSKVSLKKGLMRIGADCFRGTGITEITVPEGIYEINAGAFSDCGKLKNAVMPKKIGDKENGFGWGMFSNCSSLENVRLPENIEIIWSETFSGCTSLKQLKVPASVKEIEANNFNYCRNLKNIYFSAADCVISPVNGFALHTSLTIHAPKGGSVEKFFRFYPLIKFEAANATVTNQA